jgi:CMP-N-acetylneuraminic acid synthetase
MEPEQNSLKPRVVALIPLRGGSKSIPMKNIQPIGGKPLAYWVCKAAVDAECIDAVYVSTDSEEIQKVVESFNLGITIINRPEELSGDLATTDSAMLHFAEQVPDFDILFTIQATSPLTTGKELDEAFTHFTENEYDSLVTGVLTKRFFWTHEGAPLNYDYRTRPMRQQFGGTIMENGAFYITKKEILLKEKNRLGGTIGVYQMPEHFAVELDEPADWPIVEQLLLEQGDKET